MKKWPALIVLAAAFYLAVSGVCVQQVEDVPLAWLLCAWALSFTWLFFLLRQKVFGGPHPLLFLLGTTLGLDLFVQSTGGGQSPLVFAVFLLMGLATWEGKARYGYWVAFIFGLLEVLYLGRDPGLQGLSPYLRWATLIVCAFFLSKMAKTRQEKRILDQRLETLKNDADRLASQAEPSSVDVPKDLLLQEESRFTARLSTVLELERSLARQLVFFQRALPAHSALFFHADSFQGRQVLRLRAFSSESNDVAQDLAVPLGETLVGLCAKEGRRVLLNQVTQDSARALPYYLKPNPVSCFLALPVTLGEGGESSKEGQELVGVLVLDKIRGDLNEKEVDLAEKLATMLSETVQGSRVLHFSKTKTNNLHALLELSKSFSHLLKIEAVLKTALDTAVEISPCDCGYIALREEGSSIFTVLASNGSWGKEKPEVLEEEFSGWMLENKRTIRYVRGQKELGTGGFARKEKTLGAIQSFVIVPLLVREQILGVLRLNSSTVGAFQEYDQDILTTLANQTALAIDNAFKVNSIEALAQRDGLTGAFNHRTFQEKLSEELVKAERYNKDLCLVLLDVDHFKKFNDNYGHQEGDRVLRTVSGVIQTTVRNKVDTVARYGGEEFAVILPEADGNMGRELAERIRKNVEAHLFENDGKPLYRVTVSIGVSSYPFDGREPKTLIQTADKALYQAKAGGRNCVRVFEPSK